MIKKVVEAGLVELMIFEANGLDHSVSNLHLLITEYAVIFCVCLQRCIYGSSKSLAGSLNHRSGWSNIWLWALSDRLCAGEGKSTVVFKFITTDMMVFKVLEQAKLVLDKVKA